MIDLHHGDCLEVMHAIPDGSVDMILADLPYGTTACKWDVVIPFEPLWKHYKRVIKRNGAIVLFGSQPFTSLLVASNLQWFKYAWVWDKVNRYTGSLNANRMPLKRHEDILTFYHELPTYNKQYRRGATFGTLELRGHGSTTQWGADKRRLRNGNDGEHHNPCSIVAIPAKTCEQGLHPTQKPVALMEYLIRTYTNEGETVLDNVMGSGTTLVACVNTGRNGIGIEKDAGYYNVAEKRIQEAEKHVQEAQERIQEAQNAARQMEFAS